MREGRLAFAESWSSPVALADFTAHLWWSRTHSIWVQPPGVGDRGLIWPLREWLANLKASRQVSMKPSWWLLSSSFFLFLLLLLLFLLLLLLLLLLFLFLLLLLLLLKFILNKPFTLECCFELQKRPNGSAESPYVPCSKLPTVWVSSTPMVLWSEQRCNIDAPSFMEVQFPWILATSLSKEGPDTCSTPGWCYFYVHFWNKSSS